MVIPGGGGVGEIISLSFKNLDKIKNFRVAIEKLWARSGILGERQRIV